VQAVAAVRPQQQLRVRFELRHPRLRVEARGEVTWATLSGQCGIRFLDLSPRMTRQINEWIFANLLEGIALHARPVGAIFSESTAFPEIEDGLMVSAAPLKVIELPLRPQPVEPGRVRDETSDWLSQPLSGQSLVWTINTLVVVAALLLFALVFLSVTREPPRWPLALVGGATIFVGAFYWGFFRLFGGSSPGARLARLVGCDLEEETDDARFR
jgi:hypothetical protein